MVASLYIQGVKLEYVLTIAKLLMKGAGEDFISATSSSIGTEINKSQQAASKIIIGLENGNLIERIKVGHGYKIRVTESGVGAVKEVSNMLISAVNYSRIKITIEGTVVSGMGEGGYYMSLEGYRKRFENRLGYIPYPGTLNLKLSCSLSIKNRERIDQLPYILINGFSDSKRSYGWVKCYAVLINENHNIQAHMLVLERTHHDNTVIEVISPNYLKEALVLRNGDEVRITLVN